MPRPQEKRQISFLPGCNCFKPAGKPMNRKSAIILSLDEMESLRLADKEGLLQEEAADRMGVSRPTFTRIVGNARQKVATAIWDAKALMIEGGNVEVVGQEGRRFCCHSCDNEFSLPFGGGYPEACPQCQSTDIQRCGDRRGQCRSKRCQE